MPLSSPTLSVERTPDMPSNVTRSAVLMWSSGAGFERIDPLAPVSRIISSSLKRTWLPAASTDEPDGRSPDSGARHSRSQVE